MAVAIEELYKNGVLGDGHGMRAAADEQAVATKVAPAVPPPNGAKHKKRPLDPSIALCRNAIAEFKKLDYQEDRWPYKR